MEEKSQSCALRSSQPGLGGKRHPEFLGSDGSVGSCTASDKVQVQLETLTSLWWGKGRSEPSSWKRGHLGKRGRNQGHHSTQVFILEGLCGIWVGSR